MFGFCHKYFNITYDPDYGNAPFLQFYGCNNVYDVDESCQKVKNVLHPLFLTISIVFLIITLFTHMVEDSLRFVGFYKYKKHRYR